MSKMLEVNSCFGCTKFFSDVCMLTQKEVVANKLPSDCPLPDYDWKEKLLVWMEKNYYNSLGETAYNSIKQKIKEM